MALFRKKKKRAMILGLDGVPIGLIERLMDAGVMPAFRDLSQKGTLQSMKASLPEISAVSWTDFMTGTQSGEHGIFGFTDFRDGSYELKFPNFSDVKSRTLWDKLGDQGKRSIVVNQPSTYPARPIPGCLISGFVAINIKKSVHPLTLLRRVVEEGYSIDIPTMQCRNDHDLLMRELDETLKGRQRVVDWLWEDQDWDLFELVITGTDRLQHFVWNSVEDPSHPLHQEAMDYYANIDRLIGQLIERFVEGPGGDLSRIFLLSDHGFCAIEQEVRLNAWLEQEGYLRFLTDEPKELTDVDPQSKAFFLDPARLYINRKGRFEKGTVEEEEAEAVLEELTEGLTSLDHNGNRVVRFTLKGMEVYAGPHADRAPDLILTSHRGYDLKGTVKEKSVFGKTDLEGMHSWDDAFFWSLRPKIEDLKISDLSDIIMAELV